MKIADIDTPAVLIEKSIMEKNIRSIQRMADRHGVDLRVHIKTHKIPELAKLQIKMGAVGIAAAKLGEAEVMADAGIKDIQIANIIVGETKIKRLLKLHRRCRLTVGVDSIGNAIELSKAFSLAKRVLNVLIIVNTGLNRCGLSDNMAIIALADNCAALKSIKLVGLMTHAGHAYAASNKNEIKSIGWSKLLIFFEGGDIILISFQLVRLPPQNIVRPSRVLPNFVSAIIYLVT